MKKRDTEASAVQTWEDRLEELWAALNERTGPVYDPAEDPIWQGYQDAYETLGRRAMEDAQGRAASLTGGYGSTYAQTQGSEAYDRYLQQLWDRLPDLYGKANDAYARETEALYDRFSQALKLYEDAQAAEQAAAAAGEKKTLTAAQLEALVRAWREHGAAGVADKLAVYERLGYDLGPFYDVTGGGQ